MSSVSVVIPARNEEKHIAKVIELVRKCSLIDEIVVINNNSSDRTAEIATEAGAKVYLCKKVGKGNAMSLGLKKAKGDIILYADADIENYGEDFISKMITPILDGKYSFVKSTFDRSQGRVTTLVAKPLLELTYPKLAKFHQPLSGIIAGKRNLFERMTFEKDYGVDIGILIDAYKLGAKVKEVDIGKIENDSQDWRNLVDMSKQVTRAILKRKFKADLKNLENLENSELEKMLTN